MTQVGCPLGYTSMTNLETPIFILLLHWDAPNKPRVGFATLALMWDLRNVDSLFNLSSRLARKAYADCGVVVFATGGVA